MAITMSNQLSLMNCGQRMHLILSSWGIISLRGNVIPVFDLRKRLNIPVTAPTRKTRIIVVSEKNYTVGLIVDSVEQVVRIPDTSLEPPPPMLAAAEAGFIEGIGRHDSKMLLFLALDKILEPVTDARE